jgi:nucleotide-binding universal stress UspA family protein
MKILCPVDFSETSVHALDYGLELFKNTPDLEVSLIHCFNLASRSGMFLKMDDLLREKAEEDIATLKEKMGEKYPQVQFTHDIYKGDPKYIVPAYERKRDFDFIIIGTTGMSELKDIMIGSLTETLFEKCITPIIAVPKDIDVAVPTNILVALDDNDIENDQLFKPLRFILDQTHAKLHLCHVKDGDEEKSLEYDPTVDVQLHGLEYDYNLLDLEGTLADTIGNHARAINAELITFIHHHRTWWQRLFSQSQTKEELYHLSSPLLILNGDE